MRYLTLILALLIGNAHMAQTISSEELLEKAIAFHDPDGQWKAFNSSFKVRMETPGSSDRSSLIQLNIPKQQFNLDVEKDGVTYRYAFDKKDCTTSLNGKSEISEEDRKEYRLTCERGQVMRDYYTYLYGLPMKLRDPGTILGEEVTTKTFKGKEYLVLKVAYDEGVGNDIWYFYFDPSTYAMEVYQFYHDERKGDGEYILLTGLEEVNGIKMPKTRAWYFNKDNKYLGTDILENPM
ncbi:DUF6503 family protein [Flagellimonas myxillae]|uniref:DUF6503 family protein n=1 Tax=Flagellimonas myxillae TaxID=2942214 RepID=UPI00201E7855|nr:DUF6503 family protein [Muricauda myxillae]MCL6266856.1 DUF6503 family protein [Muricauda myxillae]